ncbi:MAG: hypothetical protein PHF63_00585 [Herbinix sp.]|nr:hypothetical protein [Herbinix sp.]
MPKEEWREMFYYLIDNFSREQLEVILSCIERRMNPYDIIDPRMSWEKMCKIRDSKHERARVIHDLKKKTSAEVIEKVQNYTTKQLNVITAASNLNIDISTYIDEYSSPELMVFYAKLIHNGIDPDTLKGVPIDIQNNEVIDYAIANKLDFSKIFTGYRDRHSRLKTRIEALKYGIDIQKYDNRDEVSDEQLREIYLGLKAGIDVSIFDNPKKFSAIQMHELRLAITKNLDLTLLLEADDWSIKIRRRKLMAEKNAGINKGDK